MIVLASSMFDLTGVANGATEIGETLFLAVAALVATLVAYGLAKQRRKL
jgi:hypothetical protein